jgi:tRNA threonylcarbamoyladenosine biosynthesis protein TsaE
MGSDPWGLNPDDVGSDPRVLELTTDAAAQTEAVAAGLAARLGTGDVVTISGELGSGKTTFVRGACRALGVVSPVTSPTFTIGHRYHGRVDVSHLDLFRFDAVTPADWGDLEPYFDDAIVFVEWPEAGVNALPRPRAEVRLRHIDGDRRQIELESEDEGLLGEVEARC